MPIARKYWLVLHARIDEAVGAEQRHKRFFDGIRHLPEPWGLAGQPIPPAPDFKRSSATIVPLTKRFGPGFIRAMLNYRYRRLLRDDGLSDDALTIVFNTSKIDTDFLIKTVMPTYIFAFDAYLAEYFDDKLIELEAQELKGLSYNPRFHVHRVGPVAFYDELLCRRAFNATPDELARRLRGTAEDLQFVGNGLYVVGSGQTSPLADAIELCREMTTLASPVAPPKFSMNNLQGGK